MIFYYYRDPVFEIQVMWINIIRFLYTRIYIIRLFTAAGATITTRDWVRWVKDRRDHPRWVNSSKKNQLPMIPMCFMNNRDAEQCQGHFFPLRPEVEHNKQTLSRSWENLNALFFFSFSLSVHSLYRNVLYSPAVIFRTRSKPV